MKAKIILIMASLLGGQMLLGQEATFRLDVLSYQWTTFNKSVTFSWPGHANTSCSGSAYTNGNISGGGNFSAETTGYSSCSTTYTPTTNQRIDLRKPVVYILAQSENRRYVLTCTRNVRWSQCHALNPGTFLARYNAGRFEVQASLGSKEEWVKFDVVQQAGTGNQQFQAAPTQLLPSDQRTHYYFLSGDSAELNNAAQSGIPYAELFLGYAYENGKGVPKNPYTALTWYQKALAHSEIAVTDRDWLEMRIKSVQATISEGSSAEAANAARPDSTPSNSQFASVTASTQANSAYLDISSTPTGAEIDVDGAFVGNTPASIEVTPGEHSITISKSGFVQWERKLKAMPGRVSLTPELQVTAAGNAGK